jgi:hypothetical protein
MLDNALFSLIISTIQIQEVIAGIPNVPIKQAFQPTNVGANSAPTAYLYKIGDHRFGWPQKLDVWDEGIETMVHTETQNYETTFQMSFLATQDPSTPDKYTASDYLNSIAYILQSDTSIDTFTTQGVGVKRIENIRNIYFMNDKSRMQAAPSFDFVMAHQQIITSSAPIVNTTEIDILTV